MMIEKPIAQLSVDAALMSAVLIFLEISRGHMAKRAKVQVPRGSRCGFAHQAPTRQGSPVLISILGWELDRSPRRVFGILTWAICQVELRTVTNTAHRTQYYQSQHRAFTFSTTNKTSIRTLSSQGFYSPEPSPAMALFT
jgi:hypothetical protein